MKHPSFRLFPRSIFMRPWKTHIPVPFLIAGSISSLIVCFYGGGLLTPCLGMINGLIVSSAAATFLFAVVAAFPFPPLELCRKLGFRKLSGRDLLLCTGALLLMLAGSALLTAFWQEVLGFFRIPFEKEQGLLQLVRDADLKTFLQLLLLTGVLVPVMEELVFRRALYAIFLKLGAPAAMLGSALIFGAAHGFLLGFPGLCFMGLVFQCIANRTRNLWCSIITHAMLNTIVMSFTFAASKLTLA